MAKRILWIENCYPISTRTQRIVDSMRRSRAVEVAVCAWDRREEGATGGVSEALRKEREYVLRTPIGYTNLACKLLQMPRFVEFAKHAIRDFQPDTVGASFWDMALLASIVAPPSAAVLYDVIDMPAGRGPMRWAGRAAELIALRRVHATLLASRFFTPFYQRQGIGALVLENLPSYVVPAEDSAHAVGSPPRIAYVGNVRYMHTLVPLMQACAQRDLPLDVWGDGSALPALRERFSHCTMIRFHGRYQYDDLPRILDSVDLLWAAYPADDFNVRYAISNKFFESISFSCPAVFSNGTALGDYVEREGIGFCVDAASESAVGAFIDGLIADSRAITDVRAALKAFKDRSAGRLTWADVEPDLVAFLRQQDMADACC